MAQACGRTEGQKDLRLSVRGPGAVPPLSKPLAPGRALWCPRPLWPVCHRTESSGQCGALVVTV